MKKIFSIAALCAAFIAGVSCSKMEQPGSPAEAGTAESGEGNYTVTFECSMADEAVSDATRTEFHDKTIWWSNGDAIRFYQRYYKTAEATDFITGSVDRSLTETQEKYSTTINFNPPAKFPVYYWALFPKESIKSSRTHFEGDDVYYAKMTVPAEQNPTADSFDPKADVLISKYITSDKKITEFQLQFRRTVALGKMTVKNLPSGENIKYIKFDNSTSYLAGDGYYELEGTGTKNNVASGTESTYVTMNYAEDSNITANSATGMTAYFTCRAFTLAKGKKFTVTVTTYAEEVFTKEVTIPETLADGLKFEEGKGTKFSVDMAKAVKGYTWLTILSENPSAYSESSHKILAFSFKCTTGTVTSMSYKRVPASDYWEAVEKGTVDELYTGMSDVPQSSLGNLNNGNKVGYTAEPGSTIIPDADYYVLVKLTDSSKGEIKTAGLVHSEPFAFLTSSNIASYTSGQFGHKFYGAGIESIKYIAVESSKIEGGLSNANCKKYFDKNIADAESISSETIKNINSKGANGYGYLKVSTTFSSGVECVELVLATMTDGTTKFCWKKQNAKV